MFDAPISASPGPTSSILEPPEEFYAIFLEAFQVSIDASISSFMKLLSKLYGLGLANLLPMASPVLLSMSLSISPIREALI